jgi:hypothetical protein
VDEEIKVSAFIVGLVTENERLREYVKRLEIALEIESEKTRSALELETGRCLVVLDLKERLEAILSECEGQSAQEET